MATGKALRPEDAPLGSLFKFHDDPTETVWRLVRIVGQDTLLFMAPGGISVLHPFEHDWRIILVPEDPTNG